jgi:hypothetical protein
MVLYIDNNSELAEIHVKTMLFVFLPILLTAFVFIMSWIKTKHANFGRLFMIFYISYFVVQQELFTKLFEIINCEKFDFDENDKGYYLKNLLGIECYTNSHYIWIFILVIPSFAIYGFIIPLSTILIARLKRSKLNFKKSSILKYDFLMRQAFNHKNPSLW